MKNIEAIELLTANMDAGVLPLTEKTMDLLKEKHPDPTRLPEDAVIDITKEDVYPIAFEGIEGDDEWVSSKENFSERFL